MALRSKESLEPYYYDGANRGSNPTNIGQVSGCHGPNFRGRIASEFPTRSELTIDRGGRHHTGTQRSRECTTPELKQDFANAQEKARQEKTN
jgi:hypothetical protein